MLNYITKRLGRNKVTVLVFHKVPAIADPMAPYEADLLGFERMLDILCTRYRVIPLQDAISGVKKGVLPNGCVSLTFDDGYANWGSDVLPALEHRQAHATFFLTTGQFDGLPLWHERIRRAVEVSNVAVPVGGEQLRMLPVTTLAEKRAAVAVLEQELKYLPLHVREERLVSIETLTGNRPELMPRMSADQARHIHSRGFAIGAHTVGHPILRHCSDSEARRELGDSRDALMALVGGAVDCLAYPNGRNLDFSAAHVQLAKDVGYQSAVTTEPGAMCTTTSLFHVPRFTPWGPGRMRMLLQMSRNQMRGSPDFREQGS